MLENYRIQQNLGSSLHSILATGLRLTLDNFDYAGCLDGLQRMRLQNGRWVMMGIGIGLLTEYATGVDFPNQLKLMLSYLGIADIYE